MGVGWGGVGGSRMSGRISQKADVSVVTGGQCWSGGGGSQAVEEDATNLLLTTILTD